MKKLTPEDLERLRRVDERGQAARENMQRILDDLAAYRQRTERQPAGIWRRVIGRSRAA
jgi:hypothetical protein